MINTIIFDIGNVLAMADWPEVFKRIGISSEVFEPVANATVRSRYWKEFDRGVLDDDRIIEGCILAAPEYEREIRMLFNNLDKIVEVTDYASEWIKYYRDRGFHTYILSNFAKKAFEACSDKFDFLKYVEGAVVSYRVKLIKPDSLIYEKLITMYDIIPSRAVFVDDLRENVQAAVNLGFNGVVFKNREQADREIEEICQKHLTRN